MTQPTDVAQRTRDLIESYLASGETAGTPEAFFNVLVNRAHQQGWYFAWDAGLTFWSDLCRVGAVAIVGGGDGGYTTGRPRYIVTERGRRLFERKDASPHNADRYLDAVRRRVTAPDVTVMVYLEEAVRAWRSDLTRSSVVMLGCACERLIIMLAHAIREATIVTYSDKVSKLLGGARPAGISEVFEQVRGALMAEAEDRRLPPDLADAIDRNLTPIFERARGLRNQHGHPTGAEVTAEDAEAGLLLFPGFYGLADRLLAYLGDRTAKESV